MLKIIETKLILIVICITSLLACNKKDTNYKFLKITDTTINNNPNTVYNELKKLNINISPDSTKMYYQILLCRAEDLCYVQHKNDSIMQKVADYYKNKNYNAEYLMQAYYCLGCIYRDLRQAKEALNYYHQALNLACFSHNYPLIGRIYNQTGQILNAGFSEQNALKAFLKSLYFFKKGKDYRVIPMVENDIAYTYNDINDKKKASIYFNRAIQHALLLKNEMIIASTLLAKAQFCIESNDYKGAATIYNMAKKSLHTKYLNQYGFYMCKGTLDYANKNYKSAIQNYIKASQNSSYAGKGAAYIYLRDIYQNGLGNKDKALLYANLTLNLVDSIRQEDDDKGIKGLQSLYDYNVVQNKNLKLSVENLRFRQYLEVGVICILAIILAVILIIFHDRKKRGQLEKTLKEKENMYEMSLKRISDNEAEISHLKQMNDKISDLKIQILEKSNNRLKEQIKNQNSSWMALRDTAVYREVHNNIENGELLCSYSHVNDLITELEKTVDLYFDNFGDRLRSYYPPINSTQIKICYLIKAEVKLSDIAVILSCSKSTITNARTRLLHQCFDSKSTLEDVDKFIHEL